MTLRLYRDDPYLLEFDARVVARREHESRPALVLDRTAFYAESGGQPWDTGVLNGVPVLAVIEDGDAILHVLEAPVAADEVHGRVDPERRRDHRQQHHGQHLLSRALVETAAAATVSFHLGAETCSIDLDRILDQPTLRAAEARANEIVWQARPVRVRSVSRSEAQALGVAPPAEAGDSIRLVEAEGFDLQPCGGTHPARTSEVGVVLVLGHERYKGGTRVRFVCGQRALAAARERGAILDRLGQRFSSALPDLVEAADRTLRQLAESQKQVRQLRERSLEADARALLEAGAGDPCVVSAVYEGWEPATLRLLAQRVTALRPCAALLASRAEKAHLVFARSEGLAVDVAALLQGALQALGGRGGGRGDVVQGGSERTEGLEQALAAAAQQARGAEPA